MEDEKSCYMMKEWYEATEAKPPLRRGSECDSVLCLLTVSSGEAEGFEQMTGYYDYDLGKFQVLREGIDILEEYELVVTHWMIVPTPTGKIL